LFPPYPNSDQRQGETTTLRVTDNTVCPPPAAPQVGGAAPLLAMAADFAIKEVEQFLQDEAKRYTASYTATAIGQHFYRPSCAVAPDQPGSIALNNINLKRFNDRYNKKEPAMELDLGVFPVDDNTAFQIIPRKVALRQSKAKIAAFDITRPLGFDLLAPWTIFQAFSGSGDVTSINGFFSGLSAFNPIRPAQIDMKVEVSLYGVWLDKDQKGHAELLANRTLSIPSVGLGKCRLYKFESPITNSATCDLDLTKEVESKLTDWKVELFPAIPRSTILNPSTGQVDHLGNGNYIVSILVTETDSFGDRITELGSTVKNNEKSITNAITGALQ